MATSLSKTNHKQKGSTTGTPDRNSSLLRTFYNSTGSRIKGFRFSRNKREAPDEERLLASYFFLC